MSHLLHVWFCLSVGRYSLLWANLWRTGHFAILERTAAVARQLTYLLINSRSLHPAIWNGRTRTLAIYKPTSVWTVLRNKLPNNISSKDQPPMLSVLKTGWNSWTLQQFLKIWWVCGVRINLKCFLISVFFYSFYTYILCHLCVTFSLYLSCCS
jgi:hypothetical protein